MMKCPICKSKIILGEQFATCQSGHDFPFSDGVYRLLHPDFEKKVTPFLNAFSDYRKPYTDKIEVEKLRELPYSYTFDRNTWEARKKDIDIFNRFVGNGKSSLKILDIGAWNCWFTHQLVKMGHEVVAVDLFIDEKDGLGANKYYDETWISIQLNLNALDVLDSTFDVIILNRCLPYFESIEQTLKLLKTQLKRSGTLFITGINNVRNPGSIIENLKRSELEFEKRYNIAFNMTSFAGYLQPGDFKTLKSEGVQIRLYAPYHPMSYKGYFFGKKSISYFGIYKAS